MKRYAIDKVRLPSFFISFIYYSFVSLTRKGFQIHIKNGINISCRIIEFPINVCLFLLSSDIAQRNVSNLSAFPTTFLKYAVF